MFGIGGFELFLILLFGFLIFGPDKLPAMAKTIGKAIAKFRNAQEEMSGVLKGEMVFDKDAEDPFKNPLDALDDVAAKASKGATAAKKAASTATKKAGQAAKKSGSTTAAAAGAAAAAAVKVEQGGDAPAKPESFAERKARYDKERQAKKEAEAEKAKKEAEEERKAAAEARKAEAAAKRAEAEAKRKAEAAAKTVSEAADAAPAAPAADTPAAEKKEN